MVVMYWEVFVVYEVGLLFTAYYAMFFNCVFGVVVFVFELRYISEVNIVCLT